MIHAYDAYAERIVFINRDVLWEDLGKDGDSTLFQSQDTVAYIFDGKIIHTSTATAFGQFVRVTFDGVDGHYLINLDWLDYSPSATTSKTYDIHKIMNHLNDVEKSRDDFMQTAEKFANLNMDRAKGLEIMGMNFYHIERIGKGEICPKCFMEWNDHEEGECSEGSLYTDWKDKYFKFVLQEFKRAVLVNEIYDGYEETSFIHREADLHKRLMSFGIKALDINRLRRSYVEELLKEFSVEGLEDFSLEDLDDSSTDRLQDEETGISSRADKQLDNDMGSLDIEIF